jgi:hypothetical protein
MAVINSVTEVLHRIRVKPYPNYLSHAGGAFDKVTEGHDAAKHPVSFRFRTRAPLRALAEHIAVEVEGLADVAGYIDEAADVTTDSVNETLTPGGMFGISGHKLKAAGDSPGAGAYFVPAGGGAAVKAGGRLAENTASKLIGVIPALSAGKWTAEVKTRFASGGTLLKEPRVIEFKGELTVP